MNIEELAQVFDGIAKGFAAGLKEKEKKELTALVGMFRRFPNQGITDFIKFVDDAFSKERNSVPALVERIQAYKQGVGEPRLELDACLATIAAADIKKILTALGIKASTKKDDNLLLLHSHLSDDSITPATIQDMSTSNLTREVEMAYVFYEEIKFELPSITIEEMRAKFTGLSTRPKPVLAGVLSKLGYPADGTQEAIAAKLLDNLTSIKISLDQTKGIGTTFNSN